MFSDRQGRLIIEKAKRDWKWFIETILKTKLYDKTAEIVDAIQKHPLVAVRSSHSSGKTYLVSRLILTFLMVNPGKSVVVTTAPTKRQVRDQMWRYLASAYHASTIPIGGQLLQTELNLTPEWYATGFTAARGETVPIQGYHSENLLIILDEASGVDPAVWSAIETLRAGGLMVRVLAIGNPTAVDVPFYDCFNKDRRLWHRIHISAYDVPNVYLKKPAIPGLATYEWVKEQYEKYGPDDPLYQIRVEGNFPTHGDVNLIQPLWVEETRARHFGADDQDMITAGFDVAHAGLDESVLAWRVGNQLLRIVPWRGMDTVESVRMIKHHLAGFRSIGKLRRISIDSVGIGAGVADQLDDAGWPVQRVNGSNRPTAFDNNYFNLRAQMWWKLREVFKNGAIAGPIDETTEQQLVNVRFWHTSEDKIRVEKKEEFKSRLRYSPDRAEAVLYCYMDAEADLDIKPTEKTDGFGEYGFVVPPEQKIATLARRLRGRHDENDPLDAESYASDPGVDAWLDRDAILPTSHPMQRVSRGYRTRIRRGYRN